MAHRQSSTERRLRRLSERRPRWTWRGLAGARWWLAGAALLVILLAGWTAFDLLRARHELLSSRNELAAAASNLSSATDAQVATRLRAATQHAMARTASAQRRIKAAPGLKLAPLVPGLSTQRRGLLRAVANARAAAAIGDHLAQVAQRQADNLTVHNGSVDVAAIQQLADAAAQAGAQLNALPRAHSGAQWGPLGHSTRDLDRLIADTAARLSHGAGVMHAAADLLGAHGPKKVFVALLNNDEMRDQGAVLSYAVADTANGGFHLSRSGSVLDIPVAHAVSDPRLSSGTQRIFGALQPAQLWQSVNASADTTLSGRLIRSMYHAATGDTVDGVVAMDVPTLAALLSVTGPVSVPGIDQPVGATNAADILLNQLYAQSPTARDPHRLEQLAATINAVVERIRTSPVNAASLVQALGGAARGGHTWVASANPDDQRALENAGLAGGPGRVHPERTIHLSVQNGTATKLDYFVDPKVDVSVAVTSDGTAVVTTKVVLSNTAPVPTPAGEQFGPDGLVTTQAGDYRGRVYFWGPDGADQLDSVAESGLRLNFALADVMPGHRATVRFTSVVPHAVQHGTLLLRFVPQARVRPIHLTVHVTGVGLHVDQPNISLVWDHAADLQWRIHGK